MRPRRHSAELLAIRNEVHGLQATFDSLAPLKPRGVAQVARDRDHASGVESLRLRTELESIQAGIDEVIRRLGVLSARRKAILAQDVNANAG